MGEPKRFEMPQETDNLIEREDTKEKYTMRSSAGSSECTINSAKSALTYKNMSDRIFFWTALVLHFSVLALAMSISNLDRVFEFLGAVGSCFYIFLFPGLSYILALRRYGTSRHRKKWETTFYLFMAWSFLALYIVILTLYIWSMTKKILSGETEGEGADLEAQ